MPRPTPRFPAPSALLCLTLCSMPACNVDAPSDGTGGTDTQPGACGRGLVVVNTDYQSTNVSLVSLDGHVLSSSFISSASADVGLSTALGGDVVLPTQRQDGDEILLLDRFPASVLTWVDVRTAEPTGQLSVAGGFAANPHDVLVLAPDKAYVTRYDPNLDSGREPLDQGDDVLVVDPSTRSIEGRIDLAPAMKDEADAYHARPDKLVMVDDRVFVLLGGYSRDFTQSVDSRIATLNPGSDSVVDVVTLEGMHGCISMTVSPSRHEIAVACAGEFAGDSVSSVADSGVVLLSTEGALAERRRFPAAKFDLGTTASVAYAGDTSLVVTTFGQFESADDPKRQDALLQVNTDTGDFEVLLRSEDTPFSFGDLRCAPACHVCFLADATRDGGVLHRFSVGPDGTLGTREQVVVDREIGLPPRNLGWF